MPVKLKGAHLMSRHYHKRSEIAEKRLILRGDVIGPPKTAKRKPAAINGSAKRITTFEHINLS